MRNTSLATVPDYEETNPEVVLKPRFPRVARWRAIVLLAAFVLAVASSVAGATFAGGASTTGKMQTGVTQCPM